MTETISGAETEFDLGTEIRSSRIVHRHTLWAMGFGIIPIPLVDAAAVTGTQIAMLASLSKNYHVPFSANAAKSIISSLIGGLGATGLAYGGVGSWLKSIPGAGSVIGALSMPLFAGATTYAIGQVFIQHFESGGTFLDFDPEKTRAQFRKYYEEGKKAAQEMKESAGKK